MTAQWIRDTYNVPAKVGMRVTVDGEPGTITSLRDHYIHVRFDNLTGRPSFPCHPTWRVSYHTDNGWTAAHD